MIDSFNSPCHLAMKYNIYFVVWFCALYSCLVFSFHFHPLVHLPNCDVIGKQARFLMGILDLGVRAYFTGWKLLFRQLGLDLGDV
jgi:hypothetical protein